MQLIIDGNVTFHVLCIICLYLGAIVIRKTIKKFPSELIPLFLICISLIVTMVHFNNFLDTDMVTVIIDAFVHGLAAVGIHQTYKQTKRYFIMKKLKMRLKNDKRKKPRLVS